MSFETKKQIIGAILLSSFDLWILISRIAGSIMFDYTMIVCIVSVIASVVCIHYLNKRIEAQESEELKEDLEDDIASTSLMALIVAGIVFCILGLLMFLDR